MSRPFIAVDWGTTNRRVYRVESNGDVSATERDGGGVLTTERGDYPAEIAAIRARFGDLPVICAGMVGSNRGWHETPYLDLPAGLAELAARMAWIEPGHTAIVPGVCHRRPGDVMRGEEVQFLGATLAHSIPDNALMCQPGTHNKWARVSSGKLVDFTTAMTGELFALLRAHSLLAAQLTGDIAPDAAFRQGVGEGGKCDLGAALFRVRAAGLLGERDDADAASYTSGLLIGADVAARIETGARVIILADPALGALYLSAIETLGGKALLHDSHTAFLAGITALWKLVQ
jgi:2-dehydro-3-deoxygalactonokinase